MWFVKGSCDRDTLCFFYRKFVYIYYNPPTDSPVNRLVDNSITLWDGWQMGKKWCSV
jgi:hypothetical protein